MILSGTVMAAFLYLGEEQVDNLFYRTFGDWMEWAFRALIFIMTTVDFSTVAVVMYRCNTILSDPLSF